MTIKFYCRYRVGGGDVRLSANRQYSAANGRVWTQMFAVDSGRTGPAVAGSGVRANSNRFWVIVARGIHPFPSRTRKLSPSAPMVLHAQVCGRVGSRPVHSKHPKGPILRSGLLFVQLPFPPSTGLLAIQYSWYSWSAFDSIRESGRVFLSDGTVAPLVFPPR